ncbi:hypothetical protein [Vibrio viridaestus]|uniref:Uncharacterized protein n=1 Tax=Vibrio viridaestus TaxID=2487322 RepID=A0A3N9THR2_9VIBR|nr:hypothetical protein [Vibrio viridaestus]RQW63580.1 hypothetical protein EES38_10060 [Vibrio viridaestus]
MSNNDLEKDFNLGGSVDRALSGDYKLSIHEILSEAFKVTVKHFVSFTPAVVLLVLLQAAIFYTALKLQVPDLTVYLQVVSDPNLLTPNLVWSFYIANFTYEVVSAPIYAGVCLMAMSHAAGLKTGTSFIGKGLQFTISVILFTMLSLILQAVSSQLFSVLSIYFSIALSHSILLICEKRMGIFQAMWVSIRATNKKLFQLFAIYAVCAALFVMAFAFYGIGLIFVLPFFLHVKGILYRNMFGIKLTIVSTSNDKSTKVFNA